MDAPVTPISPRTHATTSTEAGWRGQPHIFAVNDDTMLLNILLDLLTEHRYHVTIARFSPNTWNYIHTLRPALLIVDIKPGSQAGWRLLERLREVPRTARIPVLVTSTDTQLLHRVQEQRERYGGDIYLSQPFDHVDSLLAAVQSLTSDT